MANEVKSAGLGAASGSVAPPSGILMEARIDVAVTAVIEVNQLLWHLLHSEPGSACVTRTLIARAHLLTGACFAALDDETDESLDTLRQALRPSCWEGTGAGHA